MELYNSCDIDATSESGKFENNMDEKEKKSQVSSDGPVNECLNQFEEPEGSDTELIARLEVVGKIEEEEKAGRFATLNSDKLTAIVANSKAKGTKRNTKWFVKIFEGD